MDTEYALCSLTEGKLECTPLDLYFRDETVTFAVSGQCEIHLSGHVIDDASDESDGHGIGLVSGEVRLLEASVVPHMGWNDVEIGSDPIFSGVEPLVAYYANSYVCEPEDPVAAIAWSTYEGRRFVAGVRAARTWGVQFHPEKSSAPGRRIISNFVRLAGDFAHGGPATPEVGS